MTMARRAGMWVVLAALAGGFLLWRLTDPYRRFEGEAFVDIPRGASTSAIASFLEDAGVVRSRWDFLLARAARRGRKLQAGEYRFDKPASALDVFGRIARGDVFYYELVAPEGWNMFDIAAAVEKLGLFPAERFLEAARDPAMIRDLDPKAPTLEGYLFPDTYRLSRHTTPEQLCRIMTGRFRTVWRDLSPRDGAHETVTLASMVEKEGKIDGERPRIAAVFENRLRIGMKLDCDPTTIYAALLDERYRGAIHKSDLENRNPYNTYRNAGLPPGPITNPGRASIRAVLSPEPSAALYFVLRPDGSGQHQFSNDITAHEEATERYRRNRRK